MVDSKGRNFGCLVAAKGETTWPKKKNGSTLPYVKRSFIPY